MNNQIKLTITLLLFIGAMLIMGFFIANKDYLSQNKPQFIKNINISGSNK
ncbi:hypothetical protein GW755_03695 [bacterium]|nr:hypothetical protein [bacterium]